MVICILLDIGSFEEFIGFLISEKYESGVEYVWKIKIVFYSIRGIIIYWVSLIKF